MDTTAEDPIRSQKWAGLHGTHRKLRLISGYLPRFRRRLLLVLALLLTNGLLRLPVPFLTIYIIDDVIVAGDFRKLLQVSALIVGMSVLFIANDFVKSLTLLVFSRRMLASLQVRLLDHAQRLPISYFNQRDTGYIMSRFGVDLAVVNSFLTENLVRYLEQLIIFLIGLGAVFYIHWKLGLVSLAILPFYVLANLSYGDKLRRKNVEVQERMALSNAALHEALQGILVIKAFAREKLALRQVLRRVKETIRAEIDTFLSTSYVSMTISFLGALAPLIVLCYGGYEIMQGRLTLGELVGFNAVLAYLVGSSRSLAGMFVATQRSLGALDRVAEVLETAPEAGRGQTRPRRGQPLRGHVVFDRVTFEYVRDQPVLRDVSFEVSESSSVAIVGSSGSGKSTLVNLLLRLYEPTGGRILIDGLDLADIGLQHLRKSVGLVSQETFLFNTTVLENIRFGLPGATREQAVEAARLSHATEFIQQLPQGWDTVVGRMGFALSAGQRQRIALARAFLKQPRILILDEATSSVDSRSEELIWQALRGFTAGRTTFVISHRLSSLLSVDRIVHLEGGRVAAAGPSFQVMASPTFRNLYLNQEVSTTSSLTSASVTQ